MDKKIFLIGLNLYSIFLSLKIRSQYKNADITIIEGSGNFLNAYKEVKIKNFKLNPGFHAFEDIRSKKIINLIKKNVKFKKISKTRGIIVGKKLISYIDDFDKWPKEIINKFKIKKNKILVDFSKKNSINKHYVRYLTDNYFGKEVEIKNGLASAYPWFFPPNYDLISKDEAAIFNRNIRKKKIKHSYVFPKSGYFNEISKSLKNILNKKQIKIKLNKPISFTKIRNKIIFNGYKDIENINNKKIICIPVKPLCDSIINKVNHNKKLIPIKYYTGLIEINNSIKSELDKFCETIVSSEFAYGLIRVSQYSEIFSVQNRKIYQIEFIQHSNENNVENQIKKIIRLISNFISFKKSNNKKNIRLIGYTFLRNVFRPQINDVKEMISKTIKFFHNHENVIFPRQITWPINSNKHLLYAENDYKKKIIKFLND